MKSRLRRCAALALALLLLACLTNVPGRAAASGVYFTAANDQLMDLTADTMPFYSNGVLYVSSRLFECDELGVSYARHTSLGLATLYSSTLDLRFDLAGQVAYDKQGNFYSGYAIERGGVVFFPLNTVCRYFGLTWTLTETDIAPLIRVKSASVVLSDADFIYAATRPMSTRYSEYERSLGGRPSGPSTPVVLDPPVQAVEGQKVYLLFDGQAAHDLLPALEDVQATFLLAQEDLADGDLLRSLVAGGHALALRITAGTPDGAAEEIRQGQEALWQAACSRLELVWYEDGEEDLSQLFADMGCVRIHAGLEPPDAAAALRAIGRYREDVAVYLGGGGSLEALPELLSGLQEGRYRISAWRLTA